MDNLEELCITLHGQIQVNVIQFLLKKLFRVNILFPKAILPNFVFSPFGLCS